MHPQRNNWRVCAWLGLVVVLPYLSALTCGFVADDFARIVHDERIRSLPDALRFFDPVFWRAEAATSAVAYRPMRPFVSAIDHAVWGLDPSGFHLTNILLHVAAVALAFALLRGLGMARGAALVGAALFGLHAANVEAVAWVKNRTVLCAGAFLVLSMWLCCVRGRWGLGAVAFGIALLSHEQAAVGALWAVALMEFSGRQERAGRTWPLWGVLVLYFGVRALATAEPMAVGSLGVGMGRAALVARTVGTYGNVCALPVGLNLERALMAGGAAIAGWCVLALLVAAARWRVRGPLGAGLCAGALLLLAPVSNLLVVNPAFGRLVAEQRLYLPLIPLCALAVAALDGPRRRALLLVLLAVCAARVTHRTFDWRSDLTIYSDAVRRSPSSFKARYNFADALVREGRDAAALGAYEKSLAMRPTHGGTRCRYAEALRRVGRTHQAIAELERVLGQQPPSHAEPLAKRLLGQMRGNMPE